MGNTAIATAGSADAFRWRLAIVAVVWAVDFALLPFAPFRVVWPSFYPVVAWTLVTAGIWTTYTFWRPDAAIAAAAVATSEVLLFVLGGAILNYLGFMAHRPLFDQQLAFADQAIGFDWLRWVQGLAHIPYANDVLLAAYGSALLQVGGILIFLALSRRFAALDRFVLSFMLCALMAIGFWIVFPTFGAYIYYFALGVRVPDSGIAIDADYARELIAMHHGVFQPLRYDTVLGLIGFPSFHTGLALLCAWTMRDVRWLGPLFIAANALVLLSVPAQGGHHLIDVFGGLVAMAAAIAFVDRLCRPQGAREMLTDQPETETA